MMPRFSVLYLMLGLSFSGLASADYEFETEPITECWQEGGIIDFASFNEPDEPNFFTADQCNNAQSNANERNFFAAYGAAEMEKINDVMQDKLEPLWLDNGGHSEVLVQEGLGLMRTYNTCLESLCSLISRDCGSYNQVGDWQKNLDRCNSRKERLMELNQVQLETSLGGNVNRKKRSLFVEKMSSLSFRFDEFIHDQLSAFNRNLALAEISILALASLTW